MYGFLGGRFAQQFDMGPILHKRISIIGTTLKTRTLEYKADLLAKLGKTIFGENNDAIQPNITPVLDKVYPMTQVVEAHKYLEGNQSIGKILLKCDI